MSYKSVMVIKAFVCLGFGVLMLLVPRALFGIFGAELGPGGKFPAWEYSAALFGNLTLTWFARNAAASDARHAIILALFVYDVVGVVVSVIAVLTGILNPLGWLVVLVYLFFAWAFGSLLRVKPQIA